MTPGRPSVAIAGAGLMGRWHARAVAQAGARVTAVVDPDLSRARRLAAACPGSRPVAALAEALESSEVVHICSPVATHEALARTALEAGCHVLVEKPLAATLAGATDLVELAAARRLMLCPVHQFLFQDGVRYAMAHLERVGAIQHVGVTIRSAGASREDTAGCDRIAIEILPHPLSLLARLLRDDLATLDWTVRHPAPGELRLLTQAGSTSVFVSVSMHGRPPLNQLELVGTKGTFELDLFHGFALAHMEATATRARKIGRPFVAGSKLVGAAGANLVRRALRGETAYPGLGRLVAEFYRALARGGPSPIPTEEALAVARGSAHLADLLAREPDRRRSSALVGAD